jgi:hypothetical protein
MGSQFAKGDKVQWRSHGTTGRDAVHKPDALRRAK